MQAYYLSVQVTQPDTAGEQRTRVIWMLPETLLERIKQRAKQEHRSVPGQAAALIEEALRARDAEEAAA